MLRLFRNCRCACQRTRTICRPKNWNFCFGFFRRIILRENQLREPSKDFAIRCGFHFRGSGMDGNKLASRWRFTSPTRSPILRRRPEVFKFNIILGLQTTLTRYRPNTVGLLKKYCRCQSKLRFNWSAQRRSVTIQRRYCSTIPTKSGWTG